MDNMNYYLWQNRKDPGEAMLYGAWPHASGLSMLTGQLLTLPTAPLELEMNARSQGRLADNVPMTGQGRLFSRRLLELLWDCGVDNLQAFPCRIRNVVTGEIFEDHFAVNVVGRVACVDHGASACDYLDDERRMLLAWDYLVLDEACARDAPMFVLAEMPVQIVLHRRIKSVLETAGITGVDFVEQGDNGFNGDTEWL